MKNVILSVVIPVYNVEQYLDRCISSIIKQVNDEIEIILVDDGSTDKSGAMCDVYADSDPKINVIHKQNGGLSSARNAGLEYAKGEYIYFIDSDDLLSDGFFECIMPILKKNKYDILEFKFCWEKVLNSYEPIINNTVKEITAAKAIERIIKNEVGCQIWMRIYKKYLFENVKFPPDRNYEDIATIYKLLMIASNILLIDSEFYIYNVANMSSITKVESLKNLTDMYLSTNEFCDGVKEYCKINNIDYIYLDYFKRQTYIYIYIKILKNPDSNRYKLMEQIDDYLNANKHYNLLEYKRYDLKRLFYYKFVKIKSIFIKKQGVKNGR